MEKKKAAKKTHLSIYFRNVENFIEKKRENAANDILKRKNWNGGAMNKFKLIIYAKVEFKLFQGHFNVNAKTQDVKLCVIFHVLISRNIFNFKLWLLTLNSRKGLEKVVRNLLL